MAIAAGAKKKSSFVGRMCLKDDHEGTPNADGCYLLSFRC